MNLTKSESDVLEILLDANAPLSKSGILEHHQSTNAGKMGQFTFY